MNRAFRLAVVGVVSVAVLTGGAAAAMADSAPAPAVKRAPAQSAPVQPGPAPAAPVKRAPVKAAPAKPAPAKPAAKAALTAKASVNSVKAWEQFRVSGTATGIKAGTSVTLQQKQGAKWVSLPATVAVNKSGTYSMRVKLGIKGKNELRVAGGGAVSPVVTVTVR
ncbi:hypothetical protein AB0A77_17065 [Streptomyces varsoviensis]|uniref:hypothetical protein n=1 Tax=Streptomyces varsoviensis TaxID=67373 RepID=UPI00340D5BB8